MALRRPLRCSSCYAPHACISVGVMVCAAGIVLRRSTLSSLDLGAPCRCIPLSHHMQYGVDFPR
ncbi:hypothetical protein XMIN_2175 [Xanthomonas citri pv. mangiferaeindicae LMG 941]|nr:hypothetical protein XMIN_2175 [Xanthomonas citri pv. mangiferaeindicae LMG 941]